MVGDKSSNLALLIDGDNVSLKVIGGLMSEIANYGTASVRRIYRDWTQPSLNGWKKLLLDNSILPIQQFAYTNHKNSTDGAMIIDAMDLLYTNRFSGFCIASSDSDFTHLAARVREQGVTVYGFGERKTSTAFITACDTFVYFDALNVAALEPEEALSPLPTPASKRARTSEAVTSPQGPVHVRPTKRPLDQAALDGLAKAVNNNISYDGGYANLAAVGNYLIKISPDLNARNYGYDRLLDFVEASGIVSLKWKQMGNNPPVALVCIKEEVGNINGTHDLRGVVVGERRPPIGDSCW